MSNNLTTVSEEKTHVSRFGTPTNKRKMNMNDSSSTQCQIDGEKDNKGFTLIEILIAIVLIGILSAVAVVGISNLVSKGGSSACGATKDAATAASAVYYTSVTPNAYPLTLTALAGSGAFTLPTNVTVNPLAVTTPVAPQIVAGAGMQTTGASWYLTMTTAGSATVAPVFACN
jgi:prepilin-type N-terminal cleavage/methylation domain-containing protein